jgi:hypothetical protein
MQTHTIGQTLCIIERMNAINQQRAGTLKWGVVQTHFPSNRSGIVVSPSLPEYHRGWTTAQMAVAITVCDLFQSSQTTNSTIVGGACRAKRTNTVPTARDMYILTTTGRCGRRTHRVPVLGANCASHELLHDCATPLLRGKLDNGSRATEEVRSRLT